MDKFNNTLKILNGLIQKLETNTGGETNKVVETPQNTVQSTPAIQKVNTQQRPTQEPPKAQEKVDNKVEKKQQNKSQKAQAKVQQKAQQKNEEPKKQKKADKKNQKGEKKDIKKQEKQQKQEEKKEDAEATVEDFANIDIRIGEIVQCWKHPESEKLYCQKINVCGQVRQIASGLQQFVPLDEMKGPVIVMANLKPRPLAKFMSNGMVVCASNAEHTDVKIIRPQGAVSQRVFLEGYEQLFKTAALLPVLNPKKKILEKCSEHFKTDAQGYVTWKGIRAKTSGGYLKTQISNGTVS